MGFWKSVGKFVEGAAKATVDKVNKMNEELNVEKRKISSYSDERLFELLKSSSGIKKTAIMQTLKERGYGNNRNNQGQKSKPRSTSNNTTAAYRKGDKKDNKTTIVLSAPGQAEEKAGRPAAGQTGKTLQTAIKKMHQKDPSRFPSERLDDYTIVNAVEDVHYRSKTGRTEGKESEIINSKNMERINSLLNGSENIVALGDKAQLAVEKSNAKATVFKGNHPSMQALNKKYKSNKNNASERNEDRVTSWVNDLEESEK